MDHFEEIGFSTDLLSMSWFIQLLVNKMPRETVNLVWDMFLLKGIRAIFRAVLSAFKQVQDECFNFTRFDEVLLTIQGFFQNEFEPELFLNSLGPKISFDDFEESRKYHRRVILEKLKAQLDKGRAMMPSYEPRKQFIDKFFAYGGLPDYFEQIAEHTQREDHIVANRVLS